MTVPPEREFNACMQVLQYALLQTRAWGWAGNVSSQQLADLMDAVHNIPMLVQHWETFNEEWLLEAFDSYDRKYEASGSSSLRAIYELPVPVENKS